MGIFAIVEGNLTKNPEGRQVIVSGEPRSIVELRVFADVNRKVGDRWEQDDERSKGGGHDLQPGPGDGELLGEVADEVRFVVGDQGGGHGVQQVVVGVGGRGQGSDSRAITPPSGRGSSSSAAALP